MGAHRRSAGWSTGLLVVLGLTMVVSAGIGSASVPLSEVVGAVLDEIAVPTAVGVTVGSISLPLVGTVPVPVPTATFATPFARGVSDPVSTIVVGIRLPRIVLAAIVGCGLAAAGTVMQGLFRNPLAEPSIIGVSTGAAVGAVAAISVPALVPLSLQPMAFLTALVTAFGVYAVATRGGRTPIATLLLAGIAVQAFLGAVISYLLLHSGDSLESAVYWLMGHLHASSWSDVWVTLPIVLVGTVVLLAYARDLNVLVLGETDATHLGVEVERTKRILLAVATLVTAAGVAVAGVIGFVGLIVPHVVRLVVGPDHRVLLPASAIAGAAFLVAADTVARAGPVSVPVGIVTAAAGAPFFLYLLRTREVHEL